MKDDQIIQIYMKAELTAFIMGEAFLYGIDFVDNHYKEITKRFIKWYNGLNDEQKEKRFYDFLKNCSNGSEDGGDKNA